MIFNVCDLIRTVLDHPPVVQYAICGGLAMELHGIRSNQGHDLDVLVTEELYKKLKVGWTASDTSLGEDSGCKRYWPLENVVKIEALCINDAITTSPRLVYLVNANITSSSSGVLVVDPWDLLAWKQSIKRNQPNYAKHHADVLLIRRWLRQRETSLEVK